MWIYGELPSHIQALVLAHSVLVLAALAYLVQARQAYQARFLAHPVALHSQVAHFRVARVAQALALLPVVRHFHLAAAHSVQAVQASPVLPALPRLVVLVHHSAHRALAQVSVLALHLFHHLVQVIRSLQAHAHLALVQALHHSQVPVVRQALAHQAVLPVSLLAVVPPVSVLQVARVHSVRHQVAVAHLAVLVLAHYLVVRLPLPIISIVMILVEKSGLLIQKIWQMEILTQMLIVFFMAM